MTQTMKAKVLPFAAALLTLTAFAFASLALQTQQRDRIAVRVRFCEAINDNRTVIRNMLLVSRSQSMKFAKTPETRTQVRLFYKGLLNTAPVIECR